MDNLATRLRQLKPYSDHMHQKAADEIDRLTEALVTQTRGLDNELRRLRALALEAIRLLDAWNGPRARELLGRVNEQRTVKSPGATGAASDEVLDGDQE